MNIIDAMTDDNLFGSHFQGDTWAAWKAFLKALFALPMDEQDLPFYQQHTGRTEAPTDPFKEATLICGRRAGKSRILGLIATYLATFRDYAPYLAPGEMATVAVIASDRKQARTIFRYISGTLASVPMLANMVQDETNETITLSNRVIIEIATASFRVTRGYTFAAVLADETAFWRSDEASANPDEEIIKAIRPGLSTIPSAMLLLASSPYAKRGVLYKTFRKHWAQNDARVLVWRGSSMEMNPALDPAIVQEAYDDDPAGAAAEYGGEFRNDIASFITPEVIQACTVPDRYELPFISGNLYRAFCDPSGGSGDSFTLAIAHDEGGITVLDCVREIKPPFSPDAATKELADTIRSYGLKTVTGDRYGGEYPRERFRAHGINYTLSDKDRSGLYLEALPKLNAGKVELLDLKQIERQFCGLERRTARSGKDSVDHAPGSHDDLVNSIAGVLVQASARRMPSFAGYKSQSPYRNRSYAL
ncbi:MULTISPECIES: hypothetical protein [Gluconobacter]|uniref:Terminase n=1 Tax=Gluconobacter oxydans TaxID=442 RepID=A0AB35AM73_GLUOY|nr:MULTISPECIES: hypothetical protein [Gluconobacter]KXV31233.1 hypothetical protein AD939_07915 [Gluconobacter oxydans]MBF0856008.1 hypothetical protein [Gluconobacter oxydans]TCW27528.1 hypothetical protein EDC20_10659 [Gluconobacter oxydans]GEC60510.1 hypothetical protein GOX01_08410 [Gluconobacter oxydans]